MQKSRHFQSLKESVSQFPQEAGVYVFKGYYHSHVLEILYIGKAKNLRNRVGQYFSGSDSRSQIHILMRNVFSAEYIVTHTEKDALILERDLINQFKPRFNIRLKDDKNYVSIKLDTSHPFPRLEVCRYRPEQMRNQDLGEANFTRNRPIKVRSLQRRSKEKIEFFGPFVAGHKLRAILELIRDVIPLRTCRDHEFANRMRPCLEHGMNKCLAPCVYPVNPDLYRDLLQDAIAILRGKTEEIYAKLENEMDAAAASLNFERALVLRERLGVLDKFGSEFTVANEENAQDVFAYVREGNFFTGVVLVIRNNRLIATKNFSSNLIVDDDDEILVRMLEVFYADRDVFPREIITSKVDAIEDSVSNIVASKLRKGQDLSTYLPSLPHLKGSREILYQMALKNATELFSSRFRSEELYSLTIAKLRDMLKKMNVITSVVNRIDCVDISNLGGRDSVGAVVSFVKGVPVKRLFRVYSLPELREQDDFAAIYQVVKRRIRRGVREGSLPDLLLIDGGEGQLAKARLAIDECGTDVPVVAIAKFRNKHQRPERLVANGKTISLDTNEDVKNLLVRMRDEVHDTVVGYQRKVRERAAYSSPLDRVPGIGPQRKKLLLQQFGSVERVRNATPEEIAEKCKLPYKLAISILEELTR